MDEDTDTRTYVVVRNDELQYSIWLADQEIPSGWETTGFRGSKDACLDHVAEVWTDMRPLSVRSAMAGDEASI